MSPPLTPWETLASEPVFEHRWYRLRRETVRLPSGAVVDDYFVSERADVAVVVAVTPAREVVLVRQWKQGVRAFVTELPGGMCDEGETPADAAVRELAEETGYACAAVRPLARFEVDPSKTTHALHVFLGEGAQVATRPTWDEQEELEVVLVPLGEVRTRVADGRISSAGSVAALYRALETLERRAAS